MDLQHGLPYLKNVKISADTNLSVTKGSKVIVICAGLRQRPGESRLSLVQRNTEIYRCKKQFLTYFFKKFIYGIYFFDSHDTNIGTTQSQCHFSRRIKSSGHFDICHMEAFRFAAKSHNWLRYQS